MEALEEALTLDELFYLYRTTGKRQSRLIRAVAAAMGVPLEDDEEESFDNPNIERDQYIDGISTPVPGVIRGAQEAERMPFGLGYEMVP